MAARLAALKGKPMVRYCLLLLAMMVASSSHAAPPAQEKCSDDRGVDRCAAESETKTRAHYDLLSKEGMGEKGSYVRRAMFVDGYGRDVLAVSFIREKGRDPYVEIRTPKGDKDNKAWSLTAPISLDQWNSVLAEGRYFDRELVSEQSGDAISLCLHGWMVTAESVDPARLDPSSLPAMTRQPQLRSRTQSACGDGLTVEYGFKLADLAHSMLPICQSIPVEEHRNKAMVLNFCAMLSGDRGAAGQASSLVTEIRTIAANNRSDTVAAQKALEQSIVMADPNDKPSTPDRITRARRSELASMLAQGYLYVRNIDGVDADHAIIEAMQQQPARTNDGQAPQRTVKLFASREDGAFRIYNIEATPFSPPRTIK